MRVVGVSPRHPLGHDMPRSASSRAVVSPSRPSHPMLHNARPPRTTLALNSRIPPQSPAQSPWCCSCCGQRVD
eukprot:7016845-Prymnesium_polylepis.1